MTTFAIGSVVELETTDHHIFRGELQDFTDDYILVDGLGFALPTIKELRHA